MNYKVTGLDDQGKFCVDGKIYYVTCINPDGTLEIAMPAAELAEQELMEKEEAQPMTIHEMFPDKRDICYIIIDYTVCGRNHILVLEGEGQCVVNKKLNDFKRLCANNPNYRYNSSRWTTNSSY